MNKRRVLKLLFSLFLAMMFLTSCDQFECIKMLTTKEVFVSHLSSSGKFPIKITGEGEFVFQFEEDGSLHIILATMPFTSILNGKTIKSKDDLNELLKGQSKYQTGNLRYDYTEKGALLDYEVKEDKAIFYFTTRQVGELKGSTWTSGTSDIETLMIEVSADGKYKLLIQHFSIFPPDSIEKAVDARFQGSFSISNAILLERKIF